MRNARTEPYETSAEAPDLATWILAQIAEDERAARAATPGPWRWEGDEFEDEPSYCPHGDPWTNHGPDLVSGDDEVISASGYDASSIFVKRADAEHIARHDPARVLTECDAKRRIIAEHAEYETSDRWDGPMIKRGWCARCADWENCDFDGPPHLDYPCDTLRLLALPYADRDGYREEWKPQ